MEWGWDNARAFIGIAMIFAIAWGLSENKKAFPWKLVLGAVGIQFLFAFLMFGLPLIVGNLFGYDMKPGAIFEPINGMVDSLIAATAYGTAFVFGPVFGTQAGWEGMTGQPGPIFAVHLLPLIIVVAALSAILWHWHILRWVTKGFALVFRKGMGLGGATSLAVSANVFMGMTEAPVLIKPYIKGMTRSEIFILMTAGFATVAGSVLVLYGVFLKDVLPNAPGQLLAASLIAAPAAVALALTMVPETIDEKQRAHEPDFEYESTMDAFATGASDGLKILANIVTMLIAAFALLFLVNAGLGALPEVGGAKLSIERILGWVFSPIMYMIGVPMSEAAQSGSLMGIKTVLTEFVAFLQLSGEAGEGLSERSSMITAHAICGFANFGSIGILIGGLSIIEPSRRTTFLELAWKTLVAGTLATCLSGAVVGALPASLFFGG
ncbi:MAG: nucleoside transporter C-terminal domain-containing protein [Henriciella sp.]|jgi:CNT family concentrative nucleoside transporter